MENSTVRAAAVAALAKFAVKCGGDLASRIKVLLTRCLDDSDDEVRDRAAMYLKLLENPALCARYVADGKKNKKKRKESVMRLNSIFSPPPPPPPLDSTYSWSSLELNVINYLNADQMAHTQPFDIRATPIVTKAQEEAERLRKIILCLERGQGVRGNRFSHSYFSKQVSNLLLRKLLPKSLPLLP